MKRPCDRRIAAELREDIARLLPLRLDVGAAAEEIARLPEEAFGSYSLGMDGWQGLAIWQKGSGIKHKSFDGTFAEKPPLPVLASLAPLIDALPGSKWRVRLGRQKPGTHAPAHVDRPFRDFAKKGYRIHIPLLTNPSVYFLINRQRVVMRPGRAYYVNVCYPHEVYNLGRSTRVHLFIDLPPGPRVHDLLDASETVRSTERSSREASQAVRRFESLRSAVMAKPDKCARNVAWTLATLAKMDGTR